MSVDIIGIIDQLKLFLKNESDTVLGLAFFLIAELLIISYLISDFLTIFKPYYFHIIIAAFLLTFMVWLRNRRLGIPKDRISISVANFNILSLNIKGGIAGEEKLTLEKEIREYIKESLDFHKNKLEFSKYISVVNLPARININENNAAQYSTRLRSHILIWGTTKYVSPNEVYFEPRFEFSVEPKGLFYESFKRKLTTEQIYRIDLEKELTSLERSSLSSLFHYLIYVALLFEGIHFKNVNKFEKADHIFKVAIENISNIRNPNETLHDLYLVLRFYQGKNLHKWGNFLEKSRAKPQSYLKYDEASRILFERQKDARQNDEEGFLEHSYLYGVHLLLKQGRIEEAKRKLETIEKRFKDNPEVIKEKIELLSKRNKDKAKDFISRLSKKKIAPNERIYQQIGDFFYKTRDFRKAEEFYNKKLDMTEHQIYAPKLFDIEDHLALMKIHIQNRELIKAQRDLLSVTINKVKNMMAKEL